MIKKILIAGAMAASAAFLVPQASAQTFSPTGSFTLANVGTFTVSKGITLNCNLAGAGSVDTAGNASVSSLTLSGGGGLCGSITFTTTPYVVSGVSPSTVTINGMVVTAITGNCAGNLTGSYNQSTGVITFANATLPATSGVGACRINGQVKISPTLTF